MQQQPLGTTELSISRLGFGCMRISGTWNPAEFGDSHREKGRAALLAAYEAGYTLFDHADIYGRTTCETLHGELLADTPSLRSQTILATKCGIRFPDDPPGSPQRYDFRKEHIIASCEASLTRLQSEVIHLYQLHRPDYLMNPDEVEEAFRQLRASGKVLHFGVSNFLTSKVRALRSRVESNQVEIHLNRLDCFEDGTLDQCLELRLTPFAWSPLDRGKLADAEALGGALVPIAEELGVGVAEIALAWLMRHPSQIVPIVGSTAPARIRSMARAAEINLSHDDWYRILLASRGAPLA